ncbi:hypothetical protein GF369_04380 [Candidatus Peregrinibacteria bacterium]|nr:hypothetical protein [Candidatus Peregrinibacteria bacterium]
MGKSSQRKSPSSTSQEPPKTPKATHEHSKDRARKAAKEKHEQGKEAVKEKTKGKLGEILGGDFGSLMKKLFKTFGSFLATFDGLSDKVGNIFAAQSPEDIRKITEKSKQYKVPTVENPETKTTDILKPEKDEQLVTYLYRCLNIPVPTKEQLHPHKKLNIRHLMFQLMHSFQFKKGKKEIMKGFTKKPEQFYTDDIVFFRNSLNGVITAGFVKKIDDHTVTIETIDASGKKQTTTKYKNMCLMAFHIPGNKSKGPVKIEKREKPSYKVDI